MVPDHVAGHLALELCNTRAGWGDTHSREYLVDERSVLAWALDHDLVTGPLPALPAVRPRARPLGLVLQLRELAYPVLTGAGDPALLDRLGATVSALRSGARLTADGDGRPRWRIGAAVPSTTDPTALDDIALELALAVESLVTSSARHDVGACAGVGCGWLFLDPRHRRRWCSMAACGNRAKARRHAERRPD
jgi:predicted RNA-binding Zn ribbon-like protein